MTDTDHCCDETHHPIADCLGEFIDIAGTGYHGHWYCNYGFPDGQYPTPEQREKLEDWAGEKNVRTVDIDEDAGTITLTQAEDDCESPPTSRQRAAVETSNVAHPTHASISHCLGEIRYQGPPKGDQTFAEMIFVYEIAPGGFTDAHWDALNDWCEEQEWREFNVDLEDGIVTLGQSHEDLDAPR